MRRRIRSSLDWQWETRTCGRRIPPWICAGWSPSRKFWWVEHHIGRGKSAGAWLQRRSKGIWKWKEWRYFQSPRIAGSVGGIWECDPSWCACFELFFYTEFCRCWWVLTFNAPLFFCLPRCQFLLWGSYPELQDFKASSQLRRDEWAWTKSFGTCSICKQLKYFVKAVP